MNPVAVNATHNNKDNMIYFQDYCQISRKVQDFETKLNGMKDAPISLEEIGNTRVALHLELEKIQESFESLCQTAEVVDKWAESLDEQITSLYGQIEDFFEDRTVALIARTALELGGLLQKGSMTQVANKVDQLKGHIQLFVKQRCPSLSHRKIIELANKIADEVSTSKNGGTKLIDLLSLLQSMVEEKMQEMEQGLDPATYEKAIELYEIADLYYNYRNQEGRLRLRDMMPLLSNGQRKRLEAKSDNKEIVQTLLDMAREITHGESLGAVDYTEWFEELDAIREQPMPILRVVQA